MPAPSSVPASAETDVTDDNDSTMSPAVNATCMRMTYLSFERVSMKRTAINQGSSVSAG
jgi:hypothetical protein